MNSGPNKVYLIVGLGNPGRRYQKTRHNIGFHVVDLWGRKLKVRLRRRAFRSRYAKTGFLGQDLILIRPLTYMNQSGVAVKGWADALDLEPARILVLHDDVDLPVGRLKVVQRGGAGGHRGVASIIAHLGGQGFPRIKVGVGRPRFEEGIEDFVLSPFYRDERSVMDKVIRMAVEACRLVVLEGIQSAMTRMNCQNLAEKEEGN